MRTSPSVTLSSPQIMRSKVDLPQPEGPTNTTNSPSATSKLTPWMTCGAGEALDQSVQREAAVDAAHHLTPAEAMPWVMWRCSSAKMTVTGIRVTTVIASR